MTGPVLRRMAQVWNPLVVPGFVLVMALAACAATTAAGPGTDAAPATSGSGPVAPGAVERGSAEPELHERHRQFLAAMAARNASEVAPFFSDSAILHVAGRPAISGRAAIAEFHDGMFGFLVSSSASTDAIHVAAGGDLAYAVGSTRNAFRGADGAVEYVGKYTLVWRRYAEGWRIAVYSISSDAS